MKKIKNFGAHIGGSHLDIRRSESGVLKETGIFKCHTLCES